MNTAPGGFNGPFEPGAQSEGVLRSLRASPSSLPANESVLALGMLSYHILAALIARGVLDPNEAAKAAVDAANDMRKATEGEANQSQGEQAARSLEMIAGWTLKCGRDKEDV